MITIKNIKTIDGKTITHTIESPLNQTIDAEEKLHLLPAVIDTHVHFRTPGEEYKENWETGAKAAIYGGVTTVIDMPNNKPACISLKALNEKKALIDSQLKNVGIPLNYHLYFGADKNHLSEIKKIKDQVIGIKVYMGSTTGVLLMDDEESLDKVFQIAAENDLIVGVHAEDECMLKANKSTFCDEKDPCVHSKIRDNKAAAKATTDAINLSKKYGTRLAILHMSTKEEVELVRSAKKQGLPVFAETTPHHLFFTVDDYAKWGTKVQMNPPLRNEQDQKALWDGIHDGTIDFIGTDHAPHTLEEKNLPYGQAPSGIPGVEALLPLLLNAYHQNRLSLDQVISLTRTNAERIFQIKPNSDVVLVNLNEERLLQDEDLKTKCGWSPYSGRILKGWPVYTIVQGNVFNVSAKASAHI